MFATIANRRLIPAGTPIFVENMVAESLFIVEQGSVCLSVKAESGQDRVLEKLASGDSFGELSLLISGQRLVTAAAEKESQLVEISRRDFSALQKEKPQFCLKLILAIANHFGKRLLACRDHLKPLLLSRLPD